MKDKVCPRNIDKPLTLLGLEITELAVISIAIGALQFMFGVLGILAVTVGMIIGLKRLKKGKPDGYLQHLAYRHGLRFPGIMPPVKDGGRYSPW